MPGWGLLCTPGTQMQLRIRAEHGYGLSEVENSDFILDVADERLWRGNDSVPLTNKAFQLLKLLIEKQNVLVTKDEVLETIWGDVFVSEGLVREYVHDIRVALEDNPTAPRFIETVPRRGYRYLGGIRLMNAETSSSDTYSAGRPLVFIRPFDDLTQTDRGALVARGITDDLMTDLARLPDLVVLSVPPKNETPRSYVLHGSIQLSEEKVRVNVRLANADETPIWSERYDRELGDFLEIQSDLTGRIASTIGGAGGPLSLAERRRLNRRLPVNFKAWELYRLAFDLEIVFRRNWTRKALGLAEEAVRIDPDFARGWLVYGWVHWQIALEGWCDRETQALYRKISLDAYDRAASLDPLDPVAQMELAAVHAVRGEELNARAALERALDLGCRQADVQISCANYVASILGETTRAGQILDQALGLLGHTTKMHSLSILRVSVFNRDFERALDAAKSAPDFLQTRLFTALALAGAGQDAKAAVSAIRERVPGFDPAPYLQDHPISNKVVADQFLELCRQAGIQKSEMS